MRHRSLYYVSAKQSATKFISNSNDGYLCGLKYSRIKLNSKFLLFRYNRKVFIYLYPVRGLFLEAEPFLNLNATYRYRSIMKQFSTENVRKASYQLEVSIISQRVERDRFEKIISLSDSLMAMCFVCLIAEISL